MRFELDGSSNNLPSESFLSVLLESYKLFRTPEDQEIGFSVI